MDDTPTRPATATRAAAVIFLITGVGVGATTPFVLWHLARRGELPMTPFGFRLLAGPFERLGKGAFSELAVVLAVISTLDAVAGLWLWQGRRRGARLGLATSPLMFALGAGFAVPFLLVTVPIRVALILSGRRQLLKP
jgi:hypothetical protein